MSIVFTESHLLIATIFVLDLVGLIGGAWLLWGHRQPATPTFRRDLRVTLLWSLGLLVAASVVALTALHETAIPRFACHILYCVAAPLAIARGIWWCMQRRRALGTCLVLLGLSMTAVYYYARRIEPLALEVNHHQITSTRLGTSGDSSSDSWKGSIRAVVLADIQTDDVGSYEERIFDEVNRLRPDLILFAGDYIQCLTREAYLIQRTKFHQLFGRLTHRPAYGMFAIWGNVDPYDDLFDGTPVRVLRDEFAQLGKLPLQIYGLLDKTSSVPLRVEQLASIDAFEGLTIVLGHRPDFMDTLMRSTSDIEFISTSGHTHGGQITIPGIGALVTASIVPRKFVSGLHRIGKAWHAPSRGTGMERTFAPRIRLFCPPEIVVLEISAKAP